VATGSLLPQEFFMHRRRVSLISISLLAAVLAWAPVTLVRPAIAEKLPARLTDQEFWKLTADYSEPDGTFHSENLVSNELRFQTIIPALVKTVVPGRAYVGVGSEQNFTYIVATRPAVAFIVDIRRGNLDLHLTYKALFEMSADRADFVARLFSRARPAGLTATSTATDIFAAFANVTSSEALYQQNLKAIESHLMTQHGFALSAGDREGIQFVYRSWFEGGPDLRYQLTTGGGGGGRGPGGGARGGGGSPTYADLMTTDDGAGRARSYLATEENFRAMKDLETRNMLIPVVGNFAGPKALRAVAAYLKQHEMTVSTFYASNVEQYLHQDNIWDAFCASAATLPMDATSTLIRSTRGGFAGAPAGGNAGRGGAAFASQILPLKPEVAACAVKAPVVSR